MQETQGTDAPRGSDGSHRRQAVAPATCPFGAEAFQKSDRTTLRWLGMAGFMINVRGTILMIDPLLTGFDMPLLIEVPISAPDVPHVDAVLVTHSDNDHYSAPTCRDLLHVTRAYHSTRYVSSLASIKDMPSQGHDIGDSFDVGPAHVTLTPAEIGGAHV